MGSGFFDNNVSKNSSGFFDNNQIKENPMTPLQAEGQYLKGLGKGALKKLGEFGSSALNSPTALSEFLGGPKLYEHYQAPYEPSAPTSEVEASGQRMGPVIPEFAALLPPLAAARFVSAAPKGASFIPKLLQAGKKIGAVGGAGFAEGLALGEPERLDKAKQFGLGSAEAEGIGQLISKGLSFTPSARYKQTQLAYEKALENQATQELSLNRAKGRASVETGTSDPNRMLPLIEKKNQLISDGLARLNEIPIEEFPSTVLHEAHTQLPKIAEENLNTLNERISKIMGKGKNPDKPLAEETVRHFIGEKIPGTKRREGGLRTEIGNIFNEVRDTLTDKRINLVTKVSEEKLNTMTEAALKQLYGNTKLEVFTPKQFDLVKSSIKKDLESGNGKSLNAKTYFDTYREIEHNQGEIITKLKLAQDGKLNLSQNEIELLKKEASEMQSDMYEMEDNFQKQLDPKIFEKFKFAKHRWAREYAPVRNEPIFRLMREKGIVDKKDLIHTLRAEDDASVILRKYFQSNPKAANLLANYEFYDKPMSLQSLTEDQQKIINPKLTPHISKLIEEQTKAIQNIEKAKQEAKHFEETSKSIKAEQTRHNELLEERKKIETQIPQWHKEIQSLNDHERIIRNKLENKKIAEDEAKKLKDKLNYIEKEKEKYRKYIVGAIKFGSLEEYTRRNIIPNLMPKK